MAHAFSLSLSLNLTVASPVFLLKETYFILKVIIDYPF